MGSERPVGQGAVGRFVGAARAHPAIALGLVIGAVLVAYAVARRAAPGDSTQVKAVVSDVIDAIGAGDPEGVLARVSPHFNEEGLTYRQLAQALPRALAGRPVRGLSASFRQIVVEGSRASVLVYVESQHHAFGRGVRATSTWAVRLERMDGIWLVRGAKPEEVNQRIMGGLRAVLDMRHADH